MQVIIDRINGAFAVVEMPKGHTIEVLLEFFPENIKEGDVVEIKVNEQLTKERKKNITSKMNNLFE